MNENVGGEIRKVTNASRPLLSIPKSAFPKVVLRDSNK